MMRRNHKSDINLTALRQQMVTDHLASRDIDDERVLRAMGKIERHRFVPPTVVASAYNDGPLSIGHGQTISQPYVVASMTQSLRLKPDDRVLEIGTGCGYQTAILAELAAEVYSVEVVGPLLDRARQTLRKLGYRNINTILGDGSAGWVEKAPFDAIIVTAAAPRLPQTLVDQLAPGGRMIIPLAEDRYGRQYLTKIERTEEGIRQKMLYEVRFVPMVGDIEDREFDG